MIELWRRIEDWFTKNLPDADLCLRDPTTRDEIAEAEATLGIEFPEDFVESLLVHDGQEDHPTVFWLPAACRLGSLASLVRCWQSDREAYDDDPQRYEWLDKRRCTRQVHFHPKQIPIAGSPFWDYDRLLLDFVPGPEGRVGQVIARFDVELAVVTSSWRELLEKTLAGLETGRIRWETRGAELGGELEIVYLGPRSKKPITPWKYFA